MKLIVVSLKFTIGMVGHLRAFHDLAKSAGYEVCLYTCCKYGDYMNVDDYDMVFSVKDIAKFNPNVAIVLNVDIEVPNFISWSHQHQCKVIYILHEPYMGIGELIKEGSYIPKQAVAALLNVKICNMADLVFLCSGYALDNVRKYMPHIIKKCQRFPLIFLDEYDFNSSAERAYFSLIGGCGHAHAGDKFLDFMKFSYEAGEDIHFQIATRGDSLAKQLNQKVFREMCERGYLVIQQGRPLTAEEISMAYRRSICIWNVYRRSTQSGVLPNAFMHGTPTIASNLGSFEEFIDSGSNGIVISSTSNKEILEAYNHIKLKFNVMSENCRNSFLAEFYYASHINKFKRIIDKLSQ